LDGAGIYGAWEGFVEKVGFQFGVETVEEMDGESGDDATDEHRWVNVCMCGTS